MYSLRHGAHALRVSGLDLEVVGGVQRQLLDLVGQAVAHNWFNNPVVDLCVYICTVVDDVAYSTERSETEKTNPLFSSVAIYCITFLLVKRLQCSDQMEMEVSL